MLAVIPSIGRSPRLTALVRTLLDDGVEVTVVDNAADGSRPAWPLVAEFDQTHPARFNYVSRPRQGIYRTWNQALDEGFDRCANVLVLNDDVVIAPGAAKAIEKILVESGFGIVSFFDPGLPNQVALRPTNPAVLLADTTAPAARGEAHGLCGYAFVANPTLCARCDEAYIWYCGDQDFFYSTAKRGARIGIAHSVEVRHLEDGATTGTPDDVVDAILPPGWREHDVARIKAKWGTAHKTDHASETAATPKIEVNERPLLFVGIPSHSGRVSVELHRWLAALQGCALMGQTPFDVNVSELTGVSPVQYARNVLMRLARGTKAARVLLVDDDMIPDESTIRVILSDADICAARMYRFRHSGPNAFQASKTALPEIAACATYVKTLDDGTEERTDIVPNLGAEAPGAVLVDAVGTGCTMIKRCVIEDPRMHVGPPDDDGTPALFRMVQTPTGRITDWEDVDFSLRASRLGYTVVADFGARCGHRKAINLDAVAELLHAKNVEIEALAKRLTEATTSVVGQSTER